MKKTYTFSIDAKTNKLINLLASYETKEKGINVNRSSVVINAIHEQAKRVLPIQWQNEIEEVQNE